MQGQTIRLSVPAEPAFARSVRMMAANLAVVSGLSVEDVEDVRMAAEEGFVFACATKPATCDIEFDVAPGSLACTFALGKERNPTDSESTEPAWTYADLILSAVCDSYEVDDEAGKLCLAKQTGAAHVS